jgi:hypothetical protein
MISCRGTTANITKIMHFTPIFLFKQINLIKCMYHPFQIKYNSEVYCNNQYVFYLLSVTWLLLVEGCLSFASDFQSIMLYLFSYIMGLWIMQILAVSNFQILEFNGSLGVTLTNKLVIILCQQFETVKVNRSDLAAI